MATASRRGGLSGEYHHYTAVEVIDIAVDLRFNAGCGTGMKLGAGPRVLICRRNVGKRPCYRAK